MTDQRPKPPTETNGGDSRYDSSKNQEPSRFTTEGPAYGYRSDAPEASETPKQETPGQAQGTVGEQTTESSHFENYYRQNNGYRQERQYDPWNVDDPTQHREQTAGTSRPDEDEANLRKLVREEIRRNYRPKGMWLRALALIIIGALVGTGSGYALLKTGALGLPEEPATKQQSSPASVQIKLTNDSTVENAIAVKATPTIVGITTVVRSKQVNPFTFYTQPAYASYVGSGVIVDSNGYILTNSHVVENGNAEQITVLFSNGEQTRAKLLWHDSTLDLAVIKVDKTGLPVAELGDSDKVHVGDKAIAIGNPLGLDLQSTLTSGYISGLNRTISLEDGSIMDGLIQTDAAINSGNSGGGLFNAEGQVIGINTARPQSADGIGFAIPINSAKVIIKKVIETGSYDPLYLGISGANVQLARQMGYMGLPTDKGVLVNDVFANSPAALAGIEKGDVIISLDGKPVDSMNGLKTKLLNYKPGQKAKIEYYRGNEKKTAEIVLKAFTFPEEQNRQKQQQQQPQELLPQRP